MRAILLLFTFILMLPFAGAAQKPTYGIKAGLNMAQWKLGETSSSFKNKMRVGLITGVNADIPVSLSQPVTILAELNYAMFGSTFTTSTQKGKYKTSYLLLPVMGNFHLDNGLSIQIGPQFGYLLSAKSELYGEKGDFKDDMKKTDFFLAMGAEYQLQNGISLGCRYQHGLTNVETGADRTLRNRGFSLHATYKLKGSIQETLDEIFK